MPFIVKNTTFPNFLDLVFPHSCRGCGLIGEPFCKRCKNHIIKSHQNLCSNLKSSLPIYVVGERSGILGDLIHDYKYYSIRALARPLAEMLDEILPKDLPKNSVVIPLPTATHHIRARGLDHTYLIAKHLAKIRHYKLERILLRAKNTVQVGASRSDRLTQAKSAYIKNPKCKINKDTTYILLDDVWTTGASIKAATKLLQQAGGKNIVVAVLTYSS